MIDIAWPEMMVIAAVALIAIGPRDLPKVMRVIGKWIGKARSMARDLQRHFEQLEHETRAANSQPLHPQPPTPYAQ